MSRGAWRRSALSASPMARADLGSFWRLADECGPHAVCDLLHDDASSTFVTACVRF